MELSIQRVALLLQYDGSGFQGSQTQQPFGLPDAAIARDYPLTVQGAVNHAFEALGFPRVKSMFAGRTDKGVHALGQVAHVDCCAATLNRFKALNHSLNAKLPASIRVLEACPVSTGFHAQHQAVQKWYRYAVVSRPDRTKLLQRLDDPLFSSFTRHPFQPDLVEKALNPLVGTHDFSSFARPKNTSTHPVCTLSLAQVTQPAPQQHPDYWTLDFVGDRFLYGMVRLLVGLALKIAAGQLHPHTMQEVLKAKSFNTRMRHALIAPPEGLCLMAVDYPDALFKTTYTLP